MENIRKKIIFVDDVAVHLAAVKSRLQKYYEIYPAQSVDKLFEILEKIKPDLILLDIEMPGANGYDAIKKLKADERYADIPVIFLTSKSKNDNESVTKGFRLGAADFVSKPFSDQDLIQRIELQIDPKTRRTSWQAENIRKSIIYVDDVDYSLVSVKNRLKDYYEVYPVTSVTKMFTILERIIPDLILMDVNMPLIDGYQAIEKLKADARYKEIPVIFLTSKNNVDSVTKGIRLGAADYVCKPFTDSDLIRRIERLVNPWASE